MSRKVGLKWLNWLHQAGVGGLKLLEGAGLSMHKISNIYMSSWGLWPPCANQNYSLLSKLHVNLHWFFYDCDRDLALTLHTHFLKLSAKLLGDQECVVVSEWIYVSRNNIWNESTIWFRSLQGCFSEMYLRTASVFLPGIGRSSTCNIELQLV